VSPLVPRDGEPRWPEEVDAEREIPPASPEQLQELPGELVSMPAAQAATEERAPEREPAPIPDPAEVEVPAELREEIERAMSRYPEKRSASIPALWAVQRRYGWCTPEGISQAAAVMGVTPAYLQSVASFYDLFHLEPQGEHQVLVCTNISCWLRGADDLLQAFCEAAGTRPGESSEDGALFVRPFECLGACDLAPMVSIDERYYGPLTRDDAAAAVEQLRSGGEPLPEKRLEDRKIAGAPEAPEDDRLKGHPINRPNAKERG
jgi:NADH-quinone oxidoreductase subunit E